VREHPEKPPFSFAQDAFGDEPPQRHFLIFPPLIADPLEARGGGQLPVGSASRFSTSSRMSSPVGVGSTRISRQRSVSDAVAEGKLHSARRRRAVRHSAAEQRQLTNFPWLSSELQRDDFFDKAEPRLTHRGNGGGVRRIGSPKNLVEVR